MGEKEKGKKREKTETLLLGCMQCCGLCVILLSFASLDTIHIFFSSLHFFHTQTRSRKTHTHLQQQQQQQPKFTEQKSNKFPIKREKKRK